VLVIDVEADFVVEVAVIGSASPYPYPAAAAVALLSVVALAGVSAAVAVVQVLLAHVAVVAASAVSGGPSFGAHLIVVFWEFVLLLNDKTYFLFLSALDYLFELVLEFGIVAVAVVVVVFVV